MPSADSVLAGTLLVGLLMLASGVMLFVAGRLGELSLPFDVQLMTYGLLILLFGALAGKLLSGD